MLPLSFASLKTKVLPKTRNKKINRPKTILKTFYQQNLLFKLTILQEYLTFALEENLIHYDLTNSGFVTNKCPHTK